MIGEIIFSMIIFCIIWFVIFKTKLDYDKKKILKDIANKIELQNNKFFSDGKEFDLNSIIKGNVKEVKKVDEVKKTKKDNIKEVKKEK